MVRRICTKFGDSNQNIDQGLCTFNYVQCGAGLYLSEPTV